MSIAAIILLSVIAFTTTHYWIVAAVVLLDALLLIWEGHTKVAFYWLIAYGVMVGVFCACIYGGTFFAPFGACFLYMSKIIPAAMFASAMILSTGTGELAHALQFYRLPSRFTVVACVALRFFPAIGHEARAVREAMTVSGHRITFSNVVKRPSMMFEGFIVPFIHRVSIVADELGDAITCRGVDTRRRRTCYIEQKFGFIDAAVILIVALLLAFVIVGRVM